jgi:CxxC-x17-CxxC domain-containing protein
LQIELFCIVNDWSILMSQKNETEIKCTDCGKSANVPFKPTPGKPVYCRECLAKHRSPGSNEYRDSNADGSEKQAWSRRRTNWK